MMTMNSFVPGCANKNVKQLSKNPLVPWKRLVDINLELMSKVGKSSRSHQTSRPTVTRSINNDEHTTHSEVQIQQNPVHSHKSTSLVNISAFKTIQNPNKDSKEYKHESMVAKLNEDFTANSVKFDEMKNIQRRCCKQHEDIFTDESYRQLNNGTIDCPLMWDDVNETERCYPAKKMYPFQTKQKLDLETMKSVIYDPEMVERSSTSCDNTSEDDTVHHMIHTKVNTIVSCSQLSDNTSEDDTVHHMIHTKVNTSVSCSQLSDNTSEDDTVHHMIHTKVNTSVSCSQLSLLTKNTINSGNQSKIDDSGFATGDQTLLSMRSMTFNAETDVESEYEWADTVDLLEFHDDHGQHINTTVTSTEGAKHKVRDLDNFYKVYEMSSSPLNHLPLDNNKIHIEENSSYLNWEDMSNKPSQYNISNKPGQYNISNMPSQHNISNIPSQHNISKMPSQHNISNKPSQYNISNMPSQHNISNKPSQYNISNKPSQHNISNKPSQHNISNIPSQHNLSKMPSQHNISNKPSQYNISNMPSQHNISNKPSQYNISNSPSEYASSNLHSSLTSCLHFGVNEIQGDRTTSVTMKSLSASCLRYEGQNEMSASTFYDCESVQISDLEDSGSDLSLNKHFRDTNTTTMKSDQKLVASCDVKLLRSNNLIYGTDIGEGLKTEKLNEHFCHQKDVQGFEKKIKKNVKQISEVHQQTKCLSRDPLVSWKRLVDANIESLGEKKLGSICLAVINQAQNSIPINRQSEVKERYDVDLHRGYESIEPNTLDDFDDSAIFTESKSLLTTDSTCGQESDQMTGDYVVIDDLQFDETVDGQNSHVPDSNIYKTVPTGGLVENKVVCIVDHVDESSLGDNDKHDVSFPTLQPTCSREKQNLLIAIHSALDDISSSTFRFQNVTNRYELGSTTQHVKAADVTKPRTQNYALDAENQHPQPVQMHLETTLENNGESLPKKNTVPGYGQSNILLSAVLESPFPSFHLMPTDHIAEGGSSNDVIQTAAKFKSRKSYLHSRRPIRSKAFKKRNHVRCSHTVKVKSRTGHEHDRVESKWMDSHQDTRTAVCPAANAESKENVDIIGSGWAKFTKYINRVVTLFSTSFQSVLKIQKDSITPESYKAGEFHTISDSPSRQYSRAKRPLKNVQNGSQTSSEDKDSCDDDSVSGSGEYISQNVQNKMQKPHKQRCEEQCHVSGSDDFSEIFPDVNCLTQTDGQCFESLRSMRTFPEECTFHLTHEYGQRVKVKVENGPRTPNKSTKSTRSDMKQGFTLHRSCGTREMQKLRTGSDLSDEVTYTSSTLSVSKLKQSHHQNGRKSSHRGEISIADNANEISGHSDIDSDVSLSVTPVCYNTKARRGKAGVTLNTVNAKNETELSNFFTNERKSDKPAIETRHPSEIISDKSSKTTPTQGTPLYLWVTTPIQGRTPTRTSALTVQTSPVKLSLLTQTLPAVLQSVHIGDVQEDMCSKTLPERKDENVKDDEMLRSSLECLLEMLLQRGKVNQAFVSTVQGQILAKTSGLLITQHDIKALSCCLTSSYQGVTCITLLTMVYQCFKLDKNSSLIGKAENSVFVARQRKQTIVVGFAHPSSPGSCIKEIQELSLLLSHRGL